MRKFKKGLAFALAAAMIATTVPVTASAAPTLKANRTTVYANSAYTSGSYAKAAAVMTSSAKKAGYKISYSTKNTKLVSLSTSKAGNVIVTAKTTGKERTAASVATVTVKATKGKSTITKNFKFNVKPAAYATSVSVDKTSLNVGDKAKATGKKATSKAYSTLRYYSSNPSVVKVVDNKTGELEAVAPGTAKITAKSTISLKSSKAVEVTVKADAPVATQTGAKKITVTNGVDMKDRAVTVTRGGSTVTLDSEKKTELSADGKTMTIYTASNITEGDYTVKVADKESTFKGQKAVVSKITIDSDSAILGVKDQAVSYTEAYAYYTVSNQFGENVTDKNDVTVSGSYVDGVNKKDGKILFNTTDKAVFRLGDTLTAVVTYAADGVVVTSGSKTLKVSQQAVVNSIEVKGVWNEEGKTLTEDTLDKEEFFVLLDVKDQYDKAITKSPAKDGAVTVTLSPGLTKIGIDDNEGYVEKTVDGKKYMAIKLKKDDKNTNKNGAGQAIITIVGTSSGKFASYTIDVTDGKKVDKLSISTPSDVAVADKDITLLYTATDKAGNEVTDFDTLDKLIGTGDKSIKASKGTLRVEKDYKTGKAKIVYNAAIDGGEYTEVVSGMTDTNSYVVTQFNVRPIAVPEEITGWDDFTTGVLVDDKNGIELDRDKILIEDQYSRKYKVPSSAPVKDGYTYALTYKLEGNGVFTPSTIGSDITLTGGKVKFTANKAGSEKLTVSITKTKGNETTVVTDKEVTLNSISASQLRSYSVDDLKTIYYKEGKDKSQAKEVVVKAKANNGVTVKLPKDYYAISYGSNVTASTKVDGDKRFITATTDIASTGKALEKETSVETSINVTITSGTAADIGKDISAKVTISKDSVKAQSAKLDKDIKSTLPGITVNEDNIEISNTVTSLNALLAGIKVKDQYGMEVAANKLITGDLNAAGDLDVYQAPTITVSGLKDTSKLRITNNGTADAAISNYAQDDDFTLTVKFSGGYQFSTNVTMK